VTTNSGVNFVSVGNGSLDAVQGPLTVGGPLIAALTVNDSGDTTARTGTLSGTAITGLGMGPAGAINYGGVSQVGTLTVRTGRGGAAVTVSGTGTGVPTALNGDVLGTNTLVGPNAATTWNVTGSNAGNLSGGASASFTNFQNLTGGSAADTFVFANGAGVSGTIDGGLGMNTLNYAAYSTTVIVDLQTHTATGVGGSVLNIQNVVGGSGGGAGVYNILVGNGGNVLTGGDGRRNMLIAGGAASTLIGGNQDDILIGGTTAYDLEAGLTSLNAIMAYWSGTADDYATRVSNLLSGNGVPLLDASMVFNNGGGNVLTGHHGGAGELNLYYGLDPALETTDFSAALGEIFKNV
jgi:hypothetical protein